MRGLYATPKTLSEDYEISEASVARLKKMIIQCIPERYAEDSVINFGGKVRIRRDVFHDAIRNRYLIVRGLASRPDPALTKNCWKGEAG